MHDCMYCATPCTPAGVGCRVSGSRSPGHADVQVRVWMCGEFAVHVRLLRYV